MALEYQDHFRRNSEALSELGGASISGASLNDGLKPNSVLDRLQSLAGSLDELSKIYDHIETSIAGPMPHADKEFDRIAGPPHVMQLLVLIGQQVDRLHKQARVLAQTLGS